MAQENINQLLQNAAQCVIVVVLDLYWKSECYSLKDCRISNTRPGWTYQNPGTQSTTVLSFDAFTEADFVCGLYKDN